MLKWHHAQLQSLGLNISWSIHIEVKCNVQVPRVCVLKCDHARNQNLCSAAMWTFCILQVPFLKIHESNKKQSSALWKKQHGNDSRGAMWNKEDRLNWRPLNKLHWELMFSVSNMHRRQAEKHQLSNSPITQLLIWQPVDWSRLSSSPSPSLTSLPQHLPCLLHSHFSVQKIRNAGTHCHSRLLPPPLPPLTLTRMADFSAAARTGRPPAVDKDFFFLFK